MKEIEKHRDVLLGEAEECQLVSHLATDPLKRELFVKLAQHHRALAAELDRVLEDQGPIAH